METVDILKRVRKIEIKTKGLSNQIFSGEYHAAFKGKGMAFSEVREYQMGDEIRDIDWNVTARLNAPYVKVFEEERELSVMFLVDLSASSQFGTQQALKRHVMTELMAVLAFSAAQNNDKIGAIFFSDQIEKFIPPKKGRSHILRIIREMIDFKPEHHKTDLGHALEYLSRVIKKRSIAFLLSDFKSEPFEKPLKIVARKHDVIALNIEDPAEAALPDVGFAPLLDQETGEVIWTDTSSKKVRQNYLEKEQERKTALNKLFMLSGTDHTTISTTADYVKPLMNLFKQREFKK